MPRKKQRCCSQSAPLCSEHYQAGYGKTKRQVIAIVQNVARDEEVIKPGKIISSGWFREPEFSQAHSVLLFRRNGKRKGRRNRNRKDTKRKRDNRGSKRKDLKRKAEEKARKAEEKEGKRIEKEEKRLSRA